MIAPIVVLAFVVAVAPAADVARDDFAYASEIALEGEGSMYRASITSDVYQHVTRPDLGDLRVYNGALEVVPHAVTRPRSEPTTARVEMPLFVVSAPAATAMEDISLQVTRDQSGSILSVRAQPAKADARVFYLVDASAVKEPLAAVEVRWDESRGSHFIATLEVERSDDLKTWQPLGRGAVATLARDGHVLTQRRIEFTPRRAKYLRLTWVEPPPATRLTGASAELRRSAEPSRDWMTAAIVESTPQTGEYRFDANGRMPIDRARVVLPMNSVARVSLYARAKDGEAWRLRAQKVVFDLNEGVRSIRDNEMDVGRAGARQWLLRFERHGGGLGADGPKLELGWMPDELIFAARGAPPYTLAYGNARATPVEFGVEALTRLRDRDGEPTVNVLPARLGEPRTLRGEAALSLPWYRGDWKQWGLWAILVLAVAALAVVAFRLVRALNAERGESAGGGKSG